MTGDPKLAMLAFCESRVKIILKDIPDAQDMGKAPYHCGKIDGIQEVKREIERFPKSYSLQAIMSMLENQYGQQTFKDKVGRDMLIKELDDFEAMN